MKTQQLFNEIMNCGYRAEIVSMFSYAINKDKRFRLIVIRSQPTAELFSIVTKYDAHMRVELIRKDGNVSIEYGVYPNEPTNFDWE